MGRIAVMVVVMAMMMTTMTACGDRTGNPALDEALWNGWPGPGVGHVEKAPQTLAIAALVHRGGLFPDQDPPAIRATLDRMIRYAARRADERKASQFDMQISMQQLSRTVYRGSQQLATTRQLFMQALVNLSEPAAPPAENTARFIVREVLATPSEQQLTVPASATRAPPPSPVLPLSSPLLQENKRRAPATSRALEPRARTDGGPP